MSIKKSAVRVGVACAVALGVSAVGVAGCSSEGGALEPVALDVDTGGITPAGRYSGQVDTIGTPDLVVRQDPLLTRTRFSTEAFTTSSCTAVEGGVSAGTHKLLRFDVGTSNIGDADLVVGDPKEHVADGLFELAVCHGHYHFRHYAKYELVGADGSVWRAAKAGFCMIDTDKNVDPAHLPDRGALFTQCGTSRTKGYQGVSRGWTDTYGEDLAGQFFVLDGDGTQPPVPPGTYTIRITVNPGFVPVGTEPCRYADPNHVGVCHQLPESNFENNVGERTVIITAAETGP